MGFVFGIKVEGACLFGFLKCLTAELLNRLIAELWTSSLK